MQIFFRVGPANFVTSKRTKLYLTGYDVIQRSNPHPRHPQLLIGPGYPLLKHGIILLINYSLKLIVHIDLISQISGQGSI